jgi:type I restriction-modification system DNA methylase subunit
MTIDRIIFLRMAEDRGIEDYGRLMALLNGGDTYLRLCKIFRSADDRYNSGLFHFHAERGRDEEPDRLTPAIEIDDAVLKGIIRGLYYPESPYEFSVLPVDVLGQVYEQFLGRVIQLEDGHTASVEEKPEVRKAGGVYHTPTYIVDYIVEKTVEKLLEGKRPGSKGGVSRLKIVDPACGSGSFLIGAYTYLLDWHRDRYVEDGPDKWSDRLYEGPGGQHHLTIDEKKRILLNNIYGVDIDPQAVEVTKLSLLLKVLEGESEASLATQLRMFQERALPDLDENIKCGNSLIGPDFYDDEQMMLLDEEEHYRINVFDWEGSFPQVFEGDNPGFDAVIGNPPYGADYKAVEKAYFQSRYVFKKSKPETYIYFLERGIALLADTGILGYITPNAWLTNYYGVQIRRYVFANGGLERVVDLEPTRVFQQAVVDTAITVFMKSAQRKASQKSQVWRGTRDRQIVYQFELEQHLWESDDEAVINLQATPEELEHFTRLERDTASLNSLVEYSQGVIPYKTKAEGARNLYISQEQAEDGWVPLIERASQVRRYEVDEPTAYIQYGPWLWCARDPKFFSQPKILFHRLRKKLPRQLVGALDTAGLVNRHSLSNLILRPGIPEGNLLAVLGLFNSNFANWWFVKRYGLLMEVGGFKVGKLPLPKLWDKQQHRMVELVDRMLELHERLAGARIERERTVTGHQISATDRQIDRLVYELYGLTDEEIRIVEEATNYTRKKGRPE